MGSHQLVGGREGSWQAKEPGGGRPTTSNGPPFDLMIFVSPEWSVDRTQAIMHWVRGQVVFTQGVLSSKRPCPAGMLPSLQSAL